MPAKMLMMPLGRGVMDGLGDERGDGGHQNDVIELARGFVFGRIVGAEGEIILDRQRFGQLLQDGQTLVAQVAREHRHAGHALAEVADDVHRAHRAGRADDVDRVVGTDFGRGGNGGQGGGGVAPTVPTTRMPP